MTVRLRWTLGAFVGAACLLTGTVSAGNDDAAFSALLMQQGIEAFSEASSRGDQALMNSLLDPDVLFSGGDGTVERDTKRDKADAVSTILRRQTQAFQDAGQRGDAVAMSTYLDDEVLFINEDGVVSGRRDFARGAPAALPKGIPSTVSVSDWVVHHSGNVAVSSFVQDQVDHYDGQVLDDKFLTVQTWIKHGADWKLISSQTDPLHQDPPVVTLPAQTLNDYGGMYFVAPGFAVVISPDGSGLVSSTNGGKAVRLVAEVRDVFFTPGAPPGSPRSRIVFQRDTGGHVTGYVSSRGLVLTKSRSGGPQSGPVAPQQSVASSVLPAADLVVHRSGDVAVATFIHERVTNYPGQVLHTKYRSSETWIKHGTAWKMLTLQSRELQLDPPAPPVVTLSADELNDDVGTYAVGSSLTVTISQAGNGLTESTNGATPVPLDAQARDIFFTPGLPRTSVIFQRDAHGHATGYVKRREGRDLMFSKA